MSASDGGSPPAGWYDDPESPGGLRWWDGQAWTEHRQARSTPPGTSSGSSWGTGGGASTPVWGAGGAATPSGGASQGGAGIDTWLWQSILATIFCCQPLGIVAIVFAAQAQSAVSSGDLVTARQKAAMARTWTLVAFSIGFAVIALFLLFGVSGVFLGGW